MARISVVDFVFLDGLVRSNAPIIARIQLLDTEGEGIAQSEEITLEGFLPAFLPHVFVSGCRGGI